MSPVDDPSDEFLLEALADGAMWPMDRLYQRYSRKFYSLAYRMIGDHYIAEELVQDTFVAIWRYAASYRLRSGSARGWLFSIAHHQTIDALRSLRRRPGMKELPWDEIELEDTTLPGVFEQVDLLLLRAQVREAIKKLPGEQRMVIILAYFHGWTHLEIAQGFQLPLGTVKSRIRLGLLHLKQILAQSGIGDMTPLLPK